MADGLVARWVVKPCFFKGKFPNSVSQCSQWASERRKLALMAPAEWDEERRTAAEAYRSSHCWIWQRLDNSPGLNERDRYRAAEWVD